MAHSVVMPELGESVTEGTITQWLKSVGDTVTADEPLLEVSTDKVDTEVPSPVSGVLLEIKFEEDDTVDVGDVIAIIGEEGDAPAAKEEPAEAPKEEPKAEAADSTDVVMPELGESVTEGTITQWLKSVGDTVDVDEPLLEVSTDKVDTEVPSPVAGTILEILFNEDDTVDVGDVIVRVGTPGSAPAAKEPKAETPKKEPKAEAPKAEAADSTDVVMPELGESVTEGTITQWLKSVGDTVDVDEPLLEVSTDKVDTEVPSPVAGTILEILFNEDDTVDVGDVIVRVGTPGSAPAAKEEPAKEPKAETPKEEPKAEAPKAEPKKEAPAKTINNENVPYVTPLVRKLADKHGVDLTTVEGTGIGGRIRKQDVLAAAGVGAAPAAQVAPAQPVSAASTKSVDPEKQKLIGTTQKVNRIREITARKTVEALQISAQLTQLHEVDMTKVAELRKANKPAFQEKHGVNLTYLPFFAKAIVEALVAHPNVNASYNAETKEMTYHADVNLSIAVDTPAGLLTPVIHKAQELSLPELAKAIVDLADRARNNKLKPNDLSGGTFTITNIGSEGALSDTPILVPPQAGILGTGAIVKRPVVITEDGIDSIAIRQMVYLPLSYDHQIVDGADAGRFLTTIKDRLETANFEGDLELS
ncbi:2-oxoglutarate dehydrogenase, E2 component, dihydrolipoamide succinyltransferase [Corynebacterium diphtheriae]|uniref:2-oxoglutarate dehydrogenase, E2 component, dihydrolipoamide succinyltransferase n=1 Tax=Corynebacterium diphtheriae TaxID=1717 RepID=UPI0009C7AF10|nr:2-oxoglutarate dehydrogenase, E2 component, dihydrolipoamide succinyltransferase [Corynebacterium diphtheriae]MBG9270152.1 2-oxoglutarate dehydrogenase, E2 component, dihydrolipoamide succinyltransferase [Corynebacterium diphtheriae bv. gravis]MBG9334975.1 2-oxoglutarate dehydrogenase, E2 component, dihydrolipoamide succinyltransferase [Corynebacterium diphtheriae bv. gravis]ONF68265.1 pyruvate dehydrogenase complex dihydrolipoyllysine-residue acetyltransferase [Corynebacterium diphtheriae]C